MSEAVDLYFSFRSPYSYLAAQLTEEALAPFDVSVHLRPVLPLAIREPEFFRGANHDRVRYILMDYPRRAQMLALPHGFPNPDPIVQDMATFTIAEEQPYIFRLTYLGTEAERQGNGIPFAREVSRLIWSGTAGWDKGEHLAGAAARAGLDFASMEAAIHAEDAPHAGIVESNQRAQLAAGHTGVPLFVFRDEPFFGQDRLDTLCWRLEQEGLGKGS